MRLFFASLFTSLFLVVPSLSAQNVDSVQISSSPATQVGRGRPILEDVSRLPGKHNLVLTVQRRPTGVCSIAEAQAELNKLEMSDSLEATLVYAELHHQGDREDPGTAESLCWKKVQANFTWNLVVNAGLNWLADIMSNTTTPTVNTQCNYIGLSNGAGTPAAGDTTLATTVGAEITTNGLGRAQGTYTHSANATTYTIAHTFTATGTQSAQAGAVFTAVSSGTMCFEDTFSSASLLNGDTLSVTWTITI
jgi:hypothetical protein